MCVCARIDESWTRRLTTPGTSKAQEKYVGVGGPYWRLGVGSFGSSVTDNHLVCVARAVRVVPQSAVVFDGRSCLSSLHLK